ncbi:MAG: BlaI/MecI/CopY family transcriptional regulator, partial [Saprospiraceae bacterium]|nr:BlaI/MecI/CopY family transcriptional regulator [Saprospiraceae bacterium]
KGLVTKEIKERAHIFTAAAEEEWTQTHLLKDFVSATFRGSSSSLVMRMLGSEDTSPEDLTKIKELLFQLENIKK